MKRGDDPVEVERQTREAKAKAVALNDALAVTLQTVFDDFMKARSHKPKTVKDYNNVVNVHL